MMKFKRLVTLLLASVIALSTFNYTATASEDYGNNIADFPEDLKSSFMNILHIDGLFGDTFVTRAQFANAVCKITDGEEYPSGGSVLNNVYVDDDYADAIQYVLNRGYMTADENNNFAPNKIITCEQAVETLVCALGYREKAEWEGGYSKGFWNTGVQLGLTKYMELTRSELLDRNSANIMILNALEAPFRKAVSFDVYGNIAEYEASNLLKENFACERIRGLMTSNGLGALSGYENCSYGWVTIGAAKYKLLSDELINYIGYEVEGYSLEEDGEEYLIWCKERKNSEVKRILKGDIIGVVGFDPQDSEAHKKNPVISYEADNRNRSVKLDSSFNVIYNGVVASELSNSDFFSGEGVISFIDNDSNGKYDVVSFESYDVYVVDSVDLYENTIYLKNNAGIIELDDINADYFNMKIGRREGDISSVGKNDVLMLATEKLRANETLADARVVRIIVSANQISGKVTLITEDELKVDDALYNCSENVLNNIYINNVYTFYLDIYGKIQNAIVQTASDVEYAYYFKHTIKDPEDEYKIEILKMNNDKLILPVAEKVSYTGYNESGVWVENKNYRYDKLYYLLETQFGMSQLIKFKLNENGEIQKIIMAKDMTSERNYAGFDNDIFTKDCVLDKSEVRTNNQYILSENYRTNQNATPMIIDNGSWDSLKVMDASYLSSYMSLLRNVTVYDSTDRLITGILVAKVNKNEGAPLNYGTPSDSFYEKKLFLVKKILRTFTEDEEIKYELRGYIDGKETSYIVAEDDCEDRWSSSWSTLGYKKKITDLTFGDIIQVQLDENGEINRFMTLFSFDDELPTENKYTLSNASHEFEAILRTEYGNVSNCYSGKVIQIGNSQRRYPLTGVIYYVDIPNREISVRNTGIGVNAGDISNADFAFVKCRRTEVREIVVFRR